MGGFVSAKAAWKEAIAAAENGTLTRSLLVGLLGSSIVYAGERQPDLAPVGPRGAQHARAISAALFAALEPGCVQLIDTHLSAGGERFAWPPGLDEVIGEARKQAGEASVDRHFDAESLIVDGGRLGRNRGAALELFVQEDAPDEWSPARHDGHGVGAVNRLLDEHGLESGSIRSHCARGLVALFRAGLSLDSRFALAFIHEHKAAIDLMKERAPSEWTPDKAAARDLAVRKLEAAGVGPGRVFDHGLRDVLIAMEGGDSAKIEAVVASVKSDFDFHQRQSPAVKCVPARRRRRRSPESINESETEKEASVMAEVESVIPDEQWDAFSPDVRSLIRTELLTKLRQGVSLYHLKEAASVWLRKPF